MINGIPKWRYIVATFGVLIAGIAQARTPPDSRPDSDQLRRELRIEVTRGDDFDTERAEILLKRYAGQPVVPRLIDLAEDSTLDTSGRERALNWLGWTHDPDAEDFLLSYAKKLADPGHPKWRMQDETLYIAAVIGLGFCDTDTAADYLFEAIRPEYWQARADVVPTEWLSNVRSGIAMSVALSGAERAEQARLMNKGVPEDFRAELQREGMPELIQRWKAFRDAHPRPYPVSQKPAATSSGQPSGR